MIHWILDEDSYWKLDDYDLEELERYLCSPAIEDDAESPMQPNNGLLHEANHHLSCCCEITESRIRYNSLGSCGKTGTIGFRLSVPNDVKSCGKEDFFDSGKRSCNDTETDNKYAGSHHIKAKKEDENKKEIGFRLGGNSSTGLRLTLKTALY